MKKLKLFYAIGFISALLTANSADAQWTKAGSNIYPTTISDYVGIGTNIPVTTLQVTTTNAQAIGILGGQNGLLVLGDTNYYNLAMDSKQLQARFGATFNTLYQNFYGGNVQLGANAKPLFYKASNGFVGMGTTSPGYPLDVKKTSTSAIANFDGGNSMYISLKENGLYRGYIGSYAGAAADVDFGTGVGNTTGSVHLTIEASPKVTIISNGNVGIGTTTPANKLDVCGTIRAKEVRVETGWCDYVFANDYKLRPLSEVENYIALNKHLPDVTSGPSIESEVLEVGKVSSQMIRKIEELTLYVIEQEKAINNLKTQNASLESRLNSLDVKGGK